MRTGSIWRPGLWCKIALASCIWALGLSPQELSSDTSYRRRGQTFNFKVMADLAGWKEDVGSRGNIVLDRSKGLVFKTEHIRQEGERLSLSRPFNLPDRFAVEFRAENARSNTNRGITLSGKRRQFSLCIWFERSGWQPQGSLAVCPVAGHARGAFYGPEIGWGKWHRIRVEVDQVSRVAEVYVDGTHAHHHELAETPGVERDELTLFAGDYQDDAAEFSMEYLRIEPLSRLREVR